MSRNPNLWMPDFSDQQHQACTGTAATLVVAAPKNGGLGGSTGVQSGSSAYWFIFAAGAPISVRVGGVATAANAAFPIGFSQFPLRIAVGTSLSLICYSGTSGDFWLVHALPVE